MFAVTATFAVAVRPLLVLGYVTSENSNDILFRNLWYERQEVGKNPLPAQQASKSGAEIFSSCAPFLHALF